MIIKQICPKIKISYPELQFLSRSIESIEDSSPSDSNLHFILEKSDNKFCGSLNICSMHLNIKVEKENIDIHSLLEILNKECKKKINEWKEKRII